MRSIKRLIFPVIVASALPLLPGCGLLVTEPELNAQTARISTLERDNAQARAEAAALRADLQATRDRLDNALKANADTGSEVFSSKQRMNELSGRLDEAAHNIDDTRRDIATSRAELSARLDDLKKQIPPPAPATPPPPPAPVIPADKLAHFSALRDARDKHDYATVRLLGPEYLNRYPTDENADAALLMVGDSDREDSRPASALGSYNRILKLFPRTKLLDKTLYGMGDAYLMLHDCANAKLAYQACETRFVREKIGQEAKAKVTLISKAPPGLCAPPD